MEGRGAWIDHQLRWNPLVRELCDWAGGGRLGDVRSASFEMILPPTADYFERPYRWWYDAARGGGVLGALGSHLTDLVRFILGDIVEARGELAILRPERLDAEGNPTKVSADEVALVTLRLERGTLVDMRTAVGMPTDRTFRIQLDGTGGTARLEDGEVLSFGAPGADLEPVDGESRLSYA